jgi:hypothetical protein
MELLKFVLNLSFTKNDNQIWSGYTLSRIKRGKPYPNDMRQSRKYYTEKSLKIKASFKGLAIPQ